MERRSYLTSLGAAAGTLFLAGCSSDSTGEEPGGGSNTDQEKANKHLQNAGEALQKANEELNAQSEKFQDTDLETSFDFETSTINEHLKTANAELDKASEYSSDDLQEKIRALQDFISFIEKFVSFMDVLADGHTEVVNGLSYFDSDRFSRAAETLKTAMETISEADELLAVTRSRLEETDTTQLEDVEVSSIQTNLDKLEKQVPAYNAMAKGLRHISLGMIDFQTASKRLDEKSFEKAEKLFRDASSDFETAHSAYKANESSVPSSMKSDFIDMTCLSGALRDASEALGEASEALEAGNDDRAEKKSKEAEEAMQRCNS